MTRHVPPCAAAVHATQKLIANRRTVSEPKAARRASSFQKLLGLTENPDPAPIVGVTPSMKNAPAFRQSASRSTSYSPLRTASRLIPEYLAPSPKKTFDRTVLLENTEVQLAQSISDLSLSDGTESNPHNLWLEPQNPFFRRRNTLEIRPSGKDSLCS